VKQFGRRDRFAASTHRRLSSEYHGIISDAITFSQRDRRSAVLAEALDAAPRSMAKSAPTSHGAAPTGILQQPAGQENRSSDAAPHGRAAEGRMRSLPVPPYCQVWWQPSTWLGDRTPAVDGRVRAGLQPSYDFKSAHSDITQAR
jgi:hypothetical protein